ncbi:MAG: tetratricopeptide repeat protein [Cytophagales bacterium]|nr:tetratricopeptide repeat protein [Cytophagales bacterium]
MIKSRVFLLLFIIASTVLLYTMPRYVVNNTADEVGSQPPSSKSDNQPGEDHEHAFNIPDEVALKINEFYDSFKNANNQEKRLIFADSLAKAYKTVGKLDSLAKYIEIKAIEIPSLENFLLAGDGYYEAFNFAVDQSKRNYLAEKARTYFDRVLEENPALLDVKAKLAMTHVVGSNPMRGILMLREILEQDPENQLAIYNLGMLSITSGQLEKAIGHFKRLSSLAPENPEAYFYLGYCLFELGKLDESKSNFQKVLSLGISGDLVIASEDYLERINR